jgi:1-acyl-sn-glycerol-3-phosphate acyltransferase
MNKVDSIAVYFSRRKVFLPLSRRNSQKVELKTGFYYIALKANVPIIPAI